MIRNKRVQIVKVVSKNFVKDIVANLQNIFGKNLTFYERMIEKGTNQIEEQLDEEGIVLKWYRYEITQLTKGALAIMLYGERK